MCVSELPTRSLPVHEPPEADLLDDCWRFSCQAPQPPQKLSAAAAAAVAAHGAVARLMRLQLLAEAAAAALMAGRPLAPADEDALLQLWPLLLRLTAVAPSDPPASPFAVQSNLVLAQRPAAPAAAPASLTYPAHEQRQPCCSTTLQFDLAATANTEQAAELQIFVQQVDRSIEQSSKEALEEALSEISRLPSASAMVRGSIEGLQQPVHSLHSILRHRSGSLSPHNSLSLTGTPPPWSLNLSSPSQPPDRPAAS